MDALMMAIFDFALILENGGFRRKKEREGEVGSRKGEKILPFPIFPLVSFLPGKNLELTDHKREKGILLRANNWMEERGRNRHFSPFGHRNWCQPDPIIAASVFVFSVPSRQWHDTQKNPDEHRSNTLTRSKRAEFAHFCWISGGMKTQSHTVHRADAMQLAKSVPCKRKSRDIVDASVIKQKRLISNLGQ